MTASRAASSSLAQAAISAIVRKQPRHRPLLSSTKHTFTQGVRTGRGEWEAAIPGT
jgi:hypothetical protein